MNYCQSYIFAGMRTVSSFYLIALLAMLVSTKAQFGIKKEGVSAEVLANGRQTQNVEDLPPGMSYLTGKQNWISYNEKI